MNDNNWFKPWGKRIMGMIAKAKIISINDDTNLQTAKISLNGETHSNTERIQSYGLTSLPPAGSQAVTVFIGGNRDNPVIIACDDGRVRVKLQVGEVALYSEHGNQIILKANGDIEATPSVGQKFIINGDLDVIGTVNASVDVKAGPLNVGLATHAHPYVDTPVGAASTSVGVG